MVINEKGKKYMNGKRGMKGKRPVSVNNFNQFIVDAEHSVRGGISSYRGRKGDPYGSKTFRSLLLKLQSAHLDSVKMSKEEFPGLEFVKEDSNVSEVVISTIPVQILAFYIFKVRGVVPIMMSPTTSPKCFKMARGCHQDLAFLMNCPLIVLKTGFQEELWLSIWETWLGPLNVSQHRVKKASMDISLFDDCWWPIDHQRGHTINCIFICDFAD